MYRIKIELFIIILKIFDRLQIQHVEEFTHDIIKCLKLSVIDQLTFATAIANSNNPNIKAEGVNEYFSLLIYF